MKKVVRKSVGKILLFVLLVFAVSQFVDENDKEVSAEESSSSAAEKYLVLLMSMIQ